MDSGFKFAAVDIVLDIDKGPMILELNTRRVGYSNYK